MAQWDSSDGQNVGEGAAALAARWREEVYRLLLQGEIEDARRAEDERRCAAKVASLEVQLDQATAESQLLGQQVRLPHRSVVDLTLSAHRPQLISS